MGRAAPTLTHGGGIGLGHSSGLLARSTQATKPSCPLALAFAFFRLVSRSALGGRNVRQCLWSDQTSLECCSFREPGWELVYGLADRPMFGALHSMGIIISLASGICASIHRQLARVPSVRSVPTVQRPVL